MTSVERWAEAPPELTDHDWANLERKAKVLASSSLVPKSLQGKPSDIVAIGITAHDLGLPLTLTTLGKFFVANGKVEPTAQLMVGVALSRGHQLWWVTEADNEDRATIAGQRRGSDRVEEFTFTIKQAEDAGLLDTWVERKIQKEGDRYPTTEKITVDQPTTGPVPDKDLPEWARKKRAAGDVKRNAQWWNWRPDMLRAAATRRCCRSICPDVLLGLPNVDFDTGQPLVLERPETAGGGEPAPSAEDAATPVGDTPDDEDVVDAEVVEDGPSSYDGDTESDDHQAGDDPAELVDDTWRQSFAIACNGAGLNADQRHAIIDAATAGRTRTSKEIYRGDVGAVRRWFRAVTEGEPPEYRFLELDGIVVIAPRDQAA